MPINPNFTIEVIDSECPPPQEVDYLQLLSEHIYFDSGTAHWKKPLANRSTKHQIAGSVGKDGFRRIISTVNGKSRGVQAGRLCYFMHNGLIPDKMKIKHKNENRTDDRIANLLLVNYSLSNSGRKKSVKYSSQYYGVSWHSHKKKWRVRFRKKYIGAYKEEFKAAMAYDYAVLESGMDDFYTLNFGGYTFDLEAV